MMRMIRKRFLRRHRRCGVLTPCSRLAQSPTWCRPRHGHGTPTGPVVQMSERRREAEGAGAPGIPGSHVDQPDASRRATSRRPQTCSRTKHCSTRSTVAISPRRATRSAVAPISTPEHTRDDPDRVCRSISAATSITFLLLSLRGASPGESRRRPRRLLRPSRPANAASVAARRSPPLRSHSTQPPFRPPTRLRRVRPGRAGRSAKPPSPATRPPPSRRQRRQVRRRASSPATAALRFRRWGSWGSAASRGERDGGRLDASDRP